jgi:hypothetical protein
MIVGAAITASRMMSVDTAQTVMSECTRRRRRLFRRGGRLIRPLCRASLSFNVISSSFTTVDGCRLARLAAVSELYLGFQNRRNIRNDTFAMASRSAIPGGLLRFPRDCAESLALLDWLCRMP